VSELIGQSLNRYRLDRVIGQGSLGVVYEGRDDQQRRVAIKVMFPNLAAQDGFRRQFLRDLPLLKALPPHPNLVRLLDVDQAERWLYLVMEYMESGSLRRYLDQQKQVGAFAPLPAALDYVGQMADGLHFAHDQAIVHQDIKPENILLRPRADGQVEIAIADLKMRDLARSAHASEFTPLENALAYMAPEVCEGGHASTEADVYAVGAILYHLAVGRPPLEARNLPEAIYFHRNASIPRPLSVRQGLPFDLERIILKCLAKDPSQRYATAADLARDVHELEIRLRRTYPTLLHLETDPGFSTLANEETIRIQDRLYTQPEMTADQVGRDRLVIISPQEPTRSIPLNKTVWVIGRDMSADIVLDDVQVSRFHTRLEQMPGGGYQVIDLGSTNRTWIASRQIEPHQAVYWSPGQYLRIGPFRLVIEPVLSLLMTQPRVQESANQGVQSAQVEEAAGPPEALNIGIKVVPDRLTVIPGEQQSAQVELENFSDVVDHFIIRVNNIPSEWVLLPDSSIEVLDVKSGVDSARRNRGVETLIFKPPRESSTLAGVYSFEVVVTSSKRTNTLPVVASARLQIEPFYGFASDMKPTRLSGDRKLHISLTNTGNTPQAFTLAGSDQEEALNIVISPATLTLEPGQTVHIPILLSPKLRPLFGSTQRYPFSISVSDGRQGSPARIHEGELSLEALFSRRIIGLVAMLLVACGLGTFCSASQIITYVNQQRANEAAQAQAAAQTQTAGFQTQVAAGDPDADGLTTAEEMVLGTDPNLSDTDVDGLADGLEVRRYGTDPKALDTDKDVWDDGREVLVSNCPNGSFTSPNNPDSDGDKLPDNIDPDPCSQPTPGPPTP
jgi:serine/threonine protein kinase